MKFGDSKASKTTSKLFAIEFAFTFACLAIGRQAKVNVTLSVNSLKNF
ncbi:MAG: hypothetical protein LBP59_16035 [Planctomycetaceae bacterium]|nr:hypothetical protein [Planctomycetaceae bacterium]